MALAIKPHWQNYVDGAWHDGAGGRRIPIENPATGQVIAEIARAEAADIDRAVGAARAAFERRTLIDMRPATRAQLMFDIAAEFKKLADEIAAVECLDNGKTLAGGRNEALAAARY